MKPPKFLELEGLRGLGALSVALYHNLLGFFTLAFYGTAGVHVAVEHAAFEPVVYGNPLMVVLSGTFAVAIFFIVSGFVLGTGYFHTGDRQILWRHALRRYPRLMVPSLAATLLAAGLLWLGLSQVAAVHSITGSGWLDGRWSQSFTLFDVLRSGTIGVFTEQYSIFNTVLWTMTVELWGSFMVLAALLLVGKNPFRWVVYGLLALMTWNTWYLCFVIGMVLADVQRILANKPRQWPWSVTATLLVVAVYFGGYPVGMPVGNFYGWLSPVVQLMQAPQSLMFITAGAAALIAVVLWSGRVKKLLQHPRLSGLGSYAFALYLVHIPVLYTYTYWVFLQFLTPCGYVAAAGIAIVSSIPVVGIATYLFARYVERPSVRFTAWLSNKLLRNKS